MGRAHRQSIRKLDNQKNGVIERRNDVAISMGIVVLFGTEKKTEVCRAWERVKGDQGVFGWLTKANYPYKFFLFKKPALRLVEYFYTFQSPTL